VRCSSVDHRDCHQLNQGVIAKGSRHTEQTARRVVPTEVTPPDGAELWQLCRYPVDAPTARRSCTRGHLILVNAGTMTSTLPVAAAMVLNGG
jgi:hypothetical protein